MIEELVGVVAFALLFGALAIFRPNDREGRECHGCSIRKDTRFECGGCPADAGPGAGPGPVNDTERA